MRILVIVFLIGMILFLSCKKENDNNTIFTGITVTDNVGRISSRDTTDWKLFENWSEKENSLFDDNLNSACSTGDFDYSIIAYPNPCSGIINLHISKPETMRLAFRVVDKNYNVLITQDSLYSSTIAFNFSYIHISNETVRIYYKLYGESCAFRGHGDLKIK